MPKYFVTAEFDVSFDDEKCRSRKEEITGEIKDDVQKAIEDVVQKVETRLRRLNLWGKRYIFFRIEGASFAKCREIFYQLGWVEKMFKRDGSGSWWQK